MVYLIHFSTPIHHAKHYIGFCEDTRLDARLREHDAGRGARLTQVARERGRELVLARVWKRKGRKFERALKNRKNAPRYCPLCNPALYDMGLPDCEAVGA